MVGEEEVIPKEDDGGKELSEAGLVPVAGQELCQPSILGTNKRMRTGYCQAQSKPQLIWAEMVT